MSADDQLERGTEVRRAVLGDAHVDRVDRGSDATSPASFRR